MSSDRLPNKDTIARTASQTAAREWQRLAAQDAANGVVGAEQEVLEALQLRFSYPSKPDSASTRRNPGVPILETNSLQGEAITVTRAQAFLDGINFPSIGGTEYYAEEFPNRIIVIDVIDPTPKSETVTTRFFINPEAFKFLPSLQSLFEHARFLQADPRDLFEKGIEIEDMLASTKDIQEEDTLSIIGVPALNLESSTRIELSAFSHMIALAQLAEADSKNNLVRVAEPLVGIEVVVANKDGSLRNQMSALITRGVPFNEGSVADKLTSPDSMDSVYAKSQLMRVTAILSSYGAKIGIGDIYIHPDWLFEYSRGKFIAANCAQADAVTSLRKRA